MTTARPWPSLVAKKIPPPIFPVFLSPHLKFDKVTTKFIFLSAISCTLGELYLLLCLVNFQKTNLNSGMANQLFEVSNDFPNFTSNFRDHFTIYFAPSYSKPFCEFLIRKEKSSSGDFKKSHTRIVIIVHHSSISFSCFSCKNYM